MLPSSASSMVKGTSCVQHAHERAVLRVLHLMVRLLNQPRNGPLHVRYIHLEAVTVLHGTLYNLPDSMSQVLQWQVVTSMAERSHSLQ